MRMLGLAPGCFLVAANVTVACGVVQVVDTQPSSPNVRLTVLKDGTPQGNATFVVRWQMNGQPIRPALRTNSHGTVELRNLAPGTYCISVTADPRMGADLCLEVSKTQGRKRTKFSLSLAPLPPPPLTLAELLEQAAKSAPEMHTREFRGIVTDVAGAAIRGTAVMVYVSRVGEKPSLIKLEADENGRFSALLDSGIYAAAFQSPGFKTRFVSFEIVADQSQAMVPIVLQIGSCT
jgi:hypothetical protein